MKDRFVVPETQPDWLTLEDLDFYVSEFEHSRFRGPLNRYRNRGRDRVDLRAWNGLPIRRPSLFVGREFDGPTRRGSRAIARYPETLPGLSGVHVLDACGHWGTKSSQEW